jgi:hypothetical protein
MCCYVLRSIGKNLPLLLALLCPNLLQLLSFIRRYQRNVARAIAREYLVPALRSYFVS